MLKELSSGVIVTAMRMCLLRSDVLESVDMRIREREVGLGRIRRQS